MNDASWLLGIFGRPLRDLRTRKQRPALPPP